MSDDKPIIAVFGATGRQGGGVVRALKQQGRFRVRALTRSPAGHPDLADEVVAADLDQPDSLGPALSGVHGVFLVTNFWAPGTDELAQGRAAVAAAKAAGVQHFVWSTLPDVGKISGGRYDVPHFTGKAQLDEEVLGAGFAAATLVQAPFYFENLLGMMGPQDLGDGQRGWAMPLDPDARVVHGGAGAEVGLVAAGALADPERSAGQCLSVAAGVYAFSEIVEGFRALGHDVVYRQIPAEVYAGFFPGADEMAQMFGYWSEFTYMGPGAGPRIALAEALAIQPLTRLRTWLAENAPPPA